MDDFFEVLPALVTTAFVSLVGFLIFLWVVKSFLFVCRPNQVLIFSGRSNTLPDGRKVGYRVVFGGSSFRRPFVESVQALDVSLISVHMAVNGAYSEGGIPLSVNAIANIKISTDPKIIGNAIERFLGRDRNEIARVVKETLEGHLRGVLATLTPEEVNQDRLKFANRLKEEVEDDLSKLGLQLDTLKIQHVADERNYLESIGRKRIAEILREAEVAESDAVRLAEVAEAGARARGQVANLEAMAVVQAKENELRHIKAELEAEAKSEEERSVAAAGEARANAEKTLQRIRGELEELRLAADITIPAQAERRVRELVAAGRAAAIAANGAAQAQALEHISAAWAETGGKAMEMYVLQHLEEIVREVASAAGKLDIKKVNLIDGGDGHTISAYVSSRPKTVSVLLEEVAKVFGIDLAGALSGKKNGVAHANGLGVQLDVDGTTPSLRSES